MPEPPGDAVAPAVVEVRGCLYAAAGKSLLNAVRRAVAEGATRVDVDLTAIDEFTPDGAAALLVCRDAGGGLRDGLHYRTEPGPGQDALLSAYADPGLDRASFPAWEPES